MHLAAALKNLFIILLLIILAGHNSGYFHTQTYEVSLTQEADEKGGESDEEKHEKEYISHSLQCKTENPIKIAFGSYCCDPSLSPVQDHLTPPPDVIL